MTEVTFEFRLTVTMQVEDQSLIPELSTKIVDAVDESVKRLNPDQTNVRSYLDDIRVTPEYSYIPWSEFDPSTLPENRDWFLDTLTIEGEANSELFLSFGYQSDNESLRVRVSESELDHFEQELIRVGMMNPQRHSGDYH